MKITQPYLILWRIYLTIRGGALGVTNVQLVLIKKDLKLGNNLIENLDINNILSKFKESQAGVQRHKSPLAAFAIGYYDGVCAKTKKRNNE